MSKRIWISCTVVLLICIAFLLSRTRRPPQAVPSETNVTQVTERTAQSTARTQSTRTIPNENVPNHASPPFQLSEAERSNVIWQQIQEDWQKPIEFYGKVLDENSNAVAGASVRFQWADRTENKYIAADQSDPDGLFSLHGKLGRTLQVWVSKEGYYAAHGGYKSFMYSQSNGIYSPDSQNPVIFLLHEKRQGVELITSENGIRLKVNVRVPKDNTPVRVDFFQKRAGTDGQLEVSQIKPPWQQATNWSFSLSIPNGGFVENQDEFQFEAPEVSYQPTVEYHFTKSETNWTTQVTKQFYITFGQPRKYGWLRIESNLAQETIFLTYAINPEGSRNLEPK